jgi:hypothetical protein
MSTTNPYCEALGIEVPRLEAVKERPRANYYALLIVALLERGAPITLREAAARLEAAGVAPAQRALLSLSRCKPARPPVYREGDLYALDPHDDEADLWAFRLGLRPPRAPRLHVVRPVPAPLPSPAEPLTPRALEEAWREGVPSQWSDQRIAICVLDAHGGVLPREEAVALAPARASGRGLTARSADFWRRGAAVRVRLDGRWELDRAHAAVRPARVAVRERIAMLRRWAALRPDPAVVEASRKHFERRRRAHAEELARMRRAVLHAFPARRPEALALVDVERREIATFLGGELAEGTQRLAAYDILAAVDVRALLRALRFDPGTRRLAELGPPQKTMQTSRRRRKLRITTSLLVRSSCGISRPFAAPGVLRRYLREGQAAKLRRRLEADARSLCALYEYGRLHGAVRVRSGLLEAWIPVPWVHRDETKLFDLERRAFELRLPLEVVLGCAPDWRDPWSRAERAYVHRDEARWRSWLVDEHGCFIDDADVQLARLAGGDREAR